MNEEASNAKSTSCRRFFRVSFGGVSSSRDWSSSGVAGVRNEAAARFVHGEITNMAARCVS